MHFLNEEDKKIYLKVKELIKKLFKEEIELYINEKKAKFNFKYKKLVI